MSSTHKTPCRLAYSLATALASTGQGRLAQLVRAPALQAGGRGFEPLTAHQIIPANETFWRLVCRMPRRREQANRHSTLESRANVGGAVGRLRTECRSLPPQCARPSIAPFSCQSRRPHSGVSVRAAARSPRRPHSAPLLLSGSGSSKLCLIATSSLCSAAGGLPTVGGPGTAASCAPRAPRGRVPISSGACCLAAGRAAEQERVGEQEERDERRR